MDKNSQIKPNKKVCFLITPIGSEDCPERKRVDQWMELIYQPVLGNEYEIIRADKISAPGIITEQIIENIINSDLAVIDYTDLNPNVMYEAAIRHLAEKPYLQICSAGTRLPFDIHNLRTIFYDPLKLSYPTKLAADLREGLNDINADNYTQPQIVKEKFDFNKILADPEKFVMLLKKHIMPSKNKITPEDAIVTIDDSFSSYWTRFGRKKIICPKCGAIKYEDIENSMTTVFNNYTPIGLGDHHYKCNICGTEFQVN